MNHLFIINPRAGKGKIYKKLMENIKLCCDDSQIAYHIELTETPLHATYIVKDYVNKYQNGLRIYSAGGDGTLHEVTVGIFSCENHENVSLGVLPIGSGNDFSRNFPHANLMDIKAQINAKEILIDVLKVEINNTITYGLNSVTIGWDSEVAIDVVNFKKKPFMSGSGAYFLSIFKALSKIKYTRPLKIEIDTEEIDDNFLLSLCANGSFYGGGFMGAPRAKLDDGLIDIVMVKQVPIRKLPRLLINYKNGKHVDPENKIFHDYLIYKKTKKIMVESEVMLPVTIDGEGLYTHKLSVDILNKSLNFLAP